MDTKNTILCPNCGESINVSEVLAEQLEQGLKKDFANRLAEERKKFEGKEAQLIAQKKALEEEKARIDEEIRQAVSRKLKAELETETEKLKQKLADDSAEQLSMLQKELNEKSEKLKELNKSKVLIEQLKREKAEMKEELDLELQKQLNEKIGEEKIKIKESLDQQNELKFKEYEKKMEDQKKLMDEMRRKYEQGSMQMQGEIQELAIEEWLQTTFPLDTISEIKKGVRGGDCLQTVNTYEREGCGSIYYESKRTKEFKRSWLEKFKQDMRDKGADIGVLVTETMPGGLQRMGQLDGVWICTYEEFKSLSNILRDSIIRLSEAISSNENKGDKMEMLYSYLTNNEFRMQIDAIVEGFSQMKADLEKEKRAMQSIWKTREKQIEKVVSNTIDMYSSVKGIAGNAIGTVQALELPGEDNSDSKDQIQDDDLT